MRLRDVLELFDSWFDPGWAEPWDRVGLVCGDRESRVDAVLLTVDPDPAVISDAIDLGAQLVVAHHPLLLSGVCEVSTDTAKGRVLHQAIGSGVALFTAHTNADVAPGGTNDALAAVLGLTDREVVVPTDETTLDTLVTYVPHAHAEIVRQALARAGAGALAAYEACSFTSVGQGRFRPLPAAQPSIGSTGTMEVVEESRIETSYPTRLRAEMITALRAAHPYEEVAYSILPTEALPSAASPRPVTGLSRRGHGRIGVLPDVVTVTDFAAHVAAALPGTAHGVRVAGDPQRRVQRVAVLAGSGESMLEAAAAAGAEVVLTSDLKHHRLGEFLAELGTAAPAVVDVAHWAAEWVWLPAVAARLRDAVGDRLAVQVSTRVTDPWHFRA